MLLWGADVVGGVPYVYEDPQHKGEYIGFEMDIAKGIASTLGVKLQLVVKAWDTLIPALLLRFSAFVPVASVPMKLP